MIYVEYGNELEPLAQIGQFEMNEEVNGELTLSLVSFNIDNNPAYELLTVESIVTVEDYDFSIKEIKENSFSKEVVAISTFFNLNDKRQKEIYGGTRSFDEFAQFVFKDTDWRFTSTVQGREMIPNFGENNVVALVQQLCTVFKCEYQIMPNNHIHFSSKIGGDYDAQYRYKQNITALSKHENTSNLKTYIEGYGADKLWVSYESPYTEKFGKREAEPVHDDRFTDGQALVEHIKTMINDEPELSFELDAVELTNKELGERVWLIYEPLDIELQTRILAQKKTLVKGELQTIEVTLGNMIPKDLTDILVSQKVEIDTNKKISRTRFEQTNDKIELEATKSRESIAQLTLTANEIKSTVKDLDGRLGNAESEISQTADQIKLKVSKEDYNGETLVSMINLTPDSIKISAKSIELRGAVRVLSDITNDMGVLTAGRIVTTEDCQVGGNLTLYGAQGGINFGKAGSGTLGGINYTSRSTEVWNVGAVNISAGDVRLGNGSSSATIDFANAGSRNAHNISVGHANLAEEAKKSWETTNADYANYASSAGTAGNAENINGYRFAYSGASHNGTQNGRIYINRSQWLPVFV